MVKTRKTSFDIALAGKMNRIAAKETEKYRNLVENYDPLKNYNSFEMLNSNEPIDSKIKQLVKFSTSFKKFVTGTVLGEIPKRVSDNNITKENVKTLSKEEYFDVYSIRAAALWFHKHYSVDVKSATYKELSELIMGKIGEEEPSFLINMLTTFLYGLSIACGEIQLVKQAASISLETILHKMIFFSENGKNFPPEILTFLSNSISVPAEEPVKEKDEAEEKEENNLKVEDEELTDF